MQTAQRMRDDDENIYTIVVPLYVHLEEVIIRLGSHGRSSSISVVAKDSERRNIPYFALFRPCLLETGFDLSDVYVLPPCLFSLPTRLRMLSRRSISSSLGLL
jgi:hypothetical protein